jgi:hypothetical protein
MPDAIINGINTSFLPSSFVQNGAIVDQQKAAEVASGVQARLENMPPAEQALFLAAIKSSPDLTPDMVSKMSSGQISEALNRLTTAADSVSNAISWLFEGTRDDIKTLGKLLIQQAASEAKSALDDRLAARDAAKADLMGQAGKLKQEATEMMVVAVVSLVITCVTAAATAFFAGKEAASLKNMGKAVKGTGESAEELKNLNKLKNAYKGVDVEESKDLQKIEAKLAKLEKTRDQEFNLANTTAGFQQNLGQMANTLGGGIGSFVTTMVQADGKMKEAEGSEMAAQAQYHQSEADKAKDVQQAFEDTINKLVEFLKDMMDSKANQMQAMTKL